ncbi:MAG: Swt1 family HEPN domain-containing protein [Anaerolineaceae bacterium]
MQISVSPQSLIQILLDEFKKGMVDFLNEEVENLPVEMQQDITRNLTFTKEGNDGSKTRINDESDLYKILRILWSHWDEIKERIFTINENNGYGQTYRSYLKIIMQARNEWAHQSALTYEDVLHYGFVIQRFSRNKISKFDSSKIDQIVEVCIQKISGVDDVIGEGAPCNQDNEETTLVSELKTEEDIIEDIESTIELNDPLIVEEITTAEEENEQSGEILEDYEQNSTSEFGDDTEEIETIIQRYRKAAEEGNYEFFSELIENEDEISVLPGSYQDTLCLKENFNTFAYGYRKLQLISEYIIAVAIFAVYDFLFDSMAGTFKGYDVICIPSNKDAQITFGRTRARMLCARMKEIIDWLSDFES